MAIGEANGNYKITIGYPDRLCGLPVVTCNAPARIDSGARAPQGREMCHFGKRFSIFK